MKKLNYFLLIICFILLFAGCGIEDNDNEAVFLATVLENNSSLLVEPQTDTSESKSSDKIVVHTNSTKMYNARGEKISVSEIKVGEIIQITYNGMIAESYPAQISADKIEIME